MALPYPKNNKANPILNRTFVNFSLIFIVLALVVTGVLAFFFPFSLLTARVHIAFACAAIIFFVIHIAQRYTFFTFALFKNIKKTRLFIALSAVFSLFLVISSYYNLQPIHWLVSNSYEHKRFNEIVRSSSSVYSAFEKTTFSLIKTNETCGAGSENLAVTLTAAFHPMVKDELAFAVWAESTSGSLIESLYVSPSLAYSDSPEWYGQQTARHLVLPVWRNKYTLISGIDSDGKVDQFTGATKNHQFSLENYLKENTHEDYVIYAEINIPADTNEAWPDDLLGQPSILYSAYISHDPTKRQHAILELTGHGGSATNDGSIQYQFDKSIDADKWVDLMLVSSYPCTKQ